MLAVPVFLVACAGGGSGSPEDAAAGTNYRVVERAVERLQTRFPEATDTAVRDYVLIAVYCSVVEGKRVPSHFGMFSAEGNAEVEAIVRNFVGRARSSLRGRTREDRIEALWGDAWKRVYYVQPEDCERPRRRETRADSA